MSVCLFSTTRHVIDLYVCLSVGVAVALGSDFNPNAYCLSMVSSLIVPALKAWGYLVKHHWGYLVKHHWGYLVKYRWAIYLVEYYQGYFLFVCLCC